MYKKTKTLVIPVGPEVAGFAVAMEAKLQMEGYDQLESWSGIPIEKLMAQLKVKVERLAAADPDQPHGLFLKAVVVANLAMMIAEKTAQLRTETDESVGTGGGGDRLPAETVVTFPKQVSSEKDSQSSPAISPHLAKTTRTTRAYSSSGFRSASARK